MMTPSSLFTGLMRRQRALRLSRRIRDPFWVSALLDACLWMPDLSADAAGRLAIPDLGIRLWKDRHASFVPQIVLARQAAAEGAVTFSNDAEGGLFVTSGGITLEVAGPTDFPLFVEVVVRHIYRVLRPGPSSLVVWDIGFNVGAASLYYAAQPEVAAVYGYEPLPVAHRQGLKNLALNPHLADKITVLPYGVGRADEDIKIGYADWAITSAGAYGMMLPDGRHMPQENAVTVTLKAAPDVLRGIRRAHPDAALVVKMDCEGSEKDIIPALHAAGLLGEIDMAIIETHFPDTREIVALLSASGFRVFHPRSTHDIGMVYAARA